MPTPFPFDPTAFPEMTPADQALIADHHPAARPAFALMLLSFRRYGYFPKTADAFLSEDLAQVERLLATSVDPHAPFRLPPRTAKRFRGEIRRHRHLRPLDAAALSALEDWLRTEAVGHSREASALAALLADHCRSRGYAPPPARSRRLVQAALHAHETTVQQSILARLPAATRTALEALLQPPTPAANAALPAPAAIIDLRADPGRPGVASLEEAVARLQRLRAIALPEDLFAGIPPKDLQMWRARVAVEAPFELRRHPEAARLTWLAAFAEGRTRTLIDDLVDLLLETIHRIGARAEAKVERTMLADLKRVAGKQGLLFALAGAAVAQPDGRVRDVLFPVVNEQILNDLVKEGEATGPAYRTTLRTTIRNSYRGHYRRMVPVLLNTLAFRSNNALHRPVIEALDLIRRFAGSRQPCFPADQVVPLDGVVRGLWREAVVGAGTSSAKGETLPINRITYEICVLQALRDRIRCKEIWVVGAERYRNPDHDVPADFDQQRPAYYATLKLPDTAETFIETVRAEMQDALGTLDRGLASNPCVRVGAAKGGRITVTPLDPQPEPPNLAALKAEIGRTWPMTRLLDMLLETDRRLGFTEALRSPTAYETLDRTRLRPRLLLCLHGLGTNAGLQRMAAAGSGISTKDLQYVGQRFITLDGLRQAITMITNGTFRVRDPTWWGEATTACASDSKHFGAWDQNLTTQWHVRYGGRGVMIYWHVERKSLCIHSQLKSPSSSEVASMMEGVLRHCTEMAVDRQYVDSHGQSEVAFAFCRLLGFQLLPRLKAINRQKLYRPQAGQSEAFPQLQPVLTRPIDWPLISQQYDEMVKFATALRLGTAETEVILRRFTRSNLQHPTYRALSELGKAVKTIFLCRYLHQLELRREIHEGLNVIEHWNSANDFVFFARRGEMASNRYEHHQQAMLALHLLQNSMIYINTLMIQNILARPEWANRMAVTDLRALTPLFWEHVNPYGQYDLDPDVRIALD
ncbi:MAG: Tn3 family transposase [Betaproteobacteria bacterium]